MTTPNDTMPGLPVAQGHFLLESGYHTDVWLTLDALFVDTTRVMPLVNALADRLRPHAVSAVCGPLLGGAFLAQALAMALGVSFLFTEPGPEGPAGGGLFKATYRLPPALRERASGQRVAVVDDVISAGSSVRATNVALAEAGATTSVVASFIVLGDAAVTHFAARAVPLEALDRRPFNLWGPSDCPLCRAGAPLADPRRA
jgi:orotate phosphoribosyltransferase